MVRSTFNNALGLVLLAAATIAGISGCADISPGKLTAIQPTAVAANDHVGHAYLFRGFIGVFSTGMNSMGEKLNQDGVETTVFQADQWSEVADTIANRYSTAAAIDTVEPVVLVGHSYGADNILRIAQKLKDKNVKVDLLVTLDPVTPPKVPANVVRTVNLYQSNGVMDAMPWLRGIPLEKEVDSVTLINENIRTDRTDLLTPGLNHFNIEKQEKIHAEVEKLVMQTCITRAQWAALHSPDAKPGTAVAEAPKRAPATQSAINDAGLKLPALVSSR